MISNNYNCLFVFLRRLGHAGLLILSITSFSSLTFAQSFVPLAYDCSGRIDNDEMAAFCADSQEQVQELLWQMGARNVYHSLETVVDTLKDYPEIEASYEMIIVANSATWQEGDWSDLVPPQHMVVLKRNQGRSFFDMRGGEVRISSGVEGRFSRLTAANFQSEITGNGRPFPHPNYSGLELIPVSSGSPNHMKSFSGLFQVNWPRSLERPNRSWSLPMSYPLYLGYYYTYSNGNRERVSYAAVHGTPSQNWGYLGERRDSHGCIRTHPAVMRELRGYVESLPQQETASLNWDYELPVVNGVARQRPVLILIFNGQDGRVS